MWLPGQLPIRTLMQTPGRLPQAARVFPGDRHLGTSVAECRYGPAFTAPRSRNTCHAQATVMKE